MKQASLNAKLSGFLQDKVISKIYLSFQQLLNKNIGTKKFVVCVSVMCYINLYGLNGI